MAFISFEDVLDHLDKLGLFHMDFELERMRKALHALDLLPLPFSAVQIVGTNGKGSTATFLASLAQAHGIRTGLYTSPHFVTPRERIRINGDMLAPSLWPELASEVYKAATDLTYFEFLTVLALVAFRKAKIQLAVLEAGLGGHYDATTAIPAEVVCFTPIGMDHEKILGPTLRDIAADKAQAIRPGIPAFTVMQRPEVLSCLEQTVKEKKAVLYSVQPLSASTEKLGLTGPHQNINAGLASAVWLFLARKHIWPTTETMMEQGIAQAFLAGRFQKLPSTTETPSMLLDGAHNPHGLQALEKALADICPSAILFSCLVDKNINDMLPILCRIAGNSPVFVPTIQDNERAINAEELASRLQTCGEAQGQRMTVHPTQRLGLALQEVKCLSHPITEEHPVLLCGSLYLLGEFFTLYPWALEPESIKEHTVKTGNKITAY